MRGGILLAAAAVWCGGALVAAQPTPVPGAPPGPDVTHPYSIDRGDDGPQTPGTYKGLWLRLVDNGEPAVTPAGGVIGVVCIGMSNAAQECGALIQRLASEWRTEVNPAVRVVNCAVGGHAIERWIDPAYDASLWQGCVGRRLAQAGVAVEQVRVIYHKAANQFTTGPRGAALPTYPSAGSDYEAFLAHLTAFAARVKEWFPGVQAVYTASRSYGGFASGAARGEPLSYEEGHALNSWLAAFGEIDGVWYGWGPYLWAPPCASGETNAGGVCYERSDYVEDGVHPSTSGRLKIAALIHRRFLEHAWYRAPQ